MNHYPRFFINGNRLAFQDEENFYNDILKLKTYLEKFQNLENPFDDQFTKTIKTVEKKFKEDKWYKP